MKDYLQPAATFALALAIASIPAAWAGRGTYSLIAGQEDGSTPVKVWLMNPECKWSGAVAEGLEAKDPYRDLYE